MNDLLCGSAVVIGAGSAGLASAYQLLKSNLKVTVLERGDSAGSSWEGRYRSLRLNTVRAFSGLPGRSIDRRLGAWVSGKTFAAYLREYAEQHHLQVRTGTSVLRVRRGAEGWIVETNQGRLTADVLVVATGNAAVPIMPSWSKGFTGIVLHTASYQGPEVVAGGCVLVVGSGNSATEIATELSTQVDKVWLSVRTPPLLVKSSTLGLSTHRVSVVAAALPDRVWDAVSRASHWSLYHDLAKFGLTLPELGSHTKFRRTGAAPIAERGFAAAVRSGRIEIVPEAVGAAGEEVQLSDGRTLQPDTLILATGYKPSFPTLLSDLNVLDDKGQPKAWGTPLAGCPGLFIVGRPSLQGDIREHGLEAARVGQAVRAMNLSVPAASRPEANDDPLPA